MTAILTSIDALTESRSIILLLEQHRTELPFAEDVLAEHRATHQKLEASHTAVSAAVDTWRSALSERWEAEVHGWRLYRQTCDQLAEQYTDPNAPVLRLVEQITGEADGTPVGVLACLRRLSATLRLAGEELPALQSCIPAIDSAAGQLEQAILKTTECEHARRRAALDNRVIRETYRRVSNDTRRALFDHFGTDLDGRFQEFLQASQAADAL